MVMRRAKALERILSRMDLYIQDHERIVGNSMSTPQGIYFGIDMNWRSVRRIVDEPEGHTLLDEEGRRKLDELIGYWKGRSMSDRQQNMFTGEVLEYWKMSKMSPHTPTHALTHTRTHARAHTYTHPHPHPRTTYTIPSRENPKTSFMAEARIPPFSRM